MTTSSLPERLRYLQPIRKKLAAHPLDEVNENLDLPILSEVLRKRLKDLSVAAAQKLLREDLTELQFWLAQPKRKKDRLHFVFGFLLIAAESPEELLKDPTPSIPRLEVRMQLLEGYRITKENGCLAVIGRKIFASFAFLENNDDAERCISEFRSYTKLCSRFDKLTFADVQFGSVKGLKSVFIITHPVTRICTGKRVGYVLTVPGGQVRVDIQSKKPGNFEESALEAYFHTIEVIQFEV